MLPVTLRSAEILAFPLRQLARTQLLQNRFSFGHRIALQHWEQVSYTHGFSRMAVVQDHTDDEDIGDFVALYRGDCGWAAWWVGCERGGFAIWRSGSPQTIGWYPHLNQAFAAIFAADPAR